MENDQLFSQLPIKEMTKKLSPSDDYTKKNGNKCQTNSICY